MNTNYLDNAFDKVPTTANRDVVLKNPISMNHYEDDFCEEPCKPTSIGNELGEVLQNIKLNENLLHETVSILGVRLQPILKKQHLKDTDKVKSDVDDISEDCADLIFSLKVHSNHLINTIRQIEDLNNLLCL